MAVLVGWEAVVGCQRSGPILHVPSAADPNHRVPCDYYGMYGETCLNTGESLAAP